MATTKRKQLKRNYKIPRSLKKSIKKNLVKIVKKREREVREEERNEFSVRHEAIMTQIGMHLEQSNFLWATILVNAGLYELASEREGQKGGLIAQKALTKRILEQECTDEELREDITEWLINQGEHADEIKKLGKKGEDENEDEESGVQTTEEYDWTSTSTLE